MTSSVRSITALRREVLRDGLLGTPELTVKPRHSAFATSSSIRRCSD
jgi:hypothetical protein